MSTCRRRPWATGARLLVSDQAGRSNILAELERIGIAVPKDDPRIGRLLDEVKERESAGYAYEAADASFELLARRMLGNVPQFFDVESFRVMVERRHNAAGDLVTVSEATVKVRIDGETVLSVGEGNGPVNALDTALRKDLGRYQSFISDLELVDYKVRILTGGTDAVDPRVDREPGRGGEPLVHRRRLAQHRRCLVRGAARFHQLQADPRRRHRALIPVQVQNFAVTRASASACSARGTSARSIAGMIASICSTT